MGIPQSLTPLIQRILQGLPLLFFFELPKNSIRRLCVIMEAATKEKLKTSCLYNSINKSTVRCNPINCCL